MDNVMDILDTNTPQRTEQNERGPVTGQSEQSFASLSSDDTSVDNQRRLDEIKNAGNPLLVAARPLLRILTDIPRKLDNPETEIPVLRELLVKEIHQYQILCDQANLRREHVLAVRYCLCTAIDEAANNMPWGGNGMWASQSLLITFHGENKGGEKVFLLVGRLAANPQEHHQVLEVIYHILGLGFEGRYSVQADGRKQLDQIRQQLFALIMNQRDAVARTLSPHWQSDTTGKSRRLWAVPVWVTACLCGLCLLILFGWYNYQLSEMDTPLQQQIAAIGYKLPPPITISEKQRLRLKVLLKDEIARGVVSVNEDKKQSQVTFKGDLMFAPGKTAVNASVLPVLEKVAREIDKVNGSVIVTGHTDNQPIRTKKITSNQALSEKRASEVAAVLARKGVATSRLHIKGKGDTVPVAGNNTVDGRAQNRRVDITVME